MFFDIGGRKMQPTTGPKSREERASARPPRAEAKTSVNPHGKVALVATAVK